MCLAGMARQIQKSKGSTCSWFLGHLAPGLEKICITSFCFVFGWVFLFRGVVWSWGLVGLFVCLLAFVNHPLKIRFMEEKRSISDQ